MAGGKPPSGLTDSKELLSGPVAERAYNHLVVIGLPDDPVIQQAWQREALVTDKEIYIFGFGHLAGDIGYIESDRNPFLHSNAIASAPFETEIVTLTGTTPAGVQLAVAAFLGKGLINGVVAAPGWTRPSPSLLDRDPLPPNFTPPTVPATAANATCIGVTSPNESVYRGVLEIAGAKPSEIWQFKYHVPGAWDKGGAAYALADFFAGLNRMSIDNVLWVARFPDAGQASSAAQHIGEASHWTQQGAEWIGTPMKVGLGEDPPDRSVRLWSRDAYVYISTLPGLDSAQMP
jgi:hypothetical protein